MERINGINRVLTLLALLAALSCESEERAMERDKEMIARQFQPWEKGEASFFDLLSDHVVWEVSGTSPVSGVYKGKTEFLETAVKPIIERLEVPLKHELISLTTGSSFVFLFKASAPTKDGGVYENNYAWKVKMNGSKTVQATAFLDTYALTLLMSENKTNCLWMQLCKQWKKQKNI